MIYKIKQFLRHSLVGNWVTKKIQDSIFFPPVYRLLFFFHLTELNHAQPTDALINASKQSRIFFGQNQERVNKIVQNLADRKSKHVYNRLIQLRSYLKIPPIFSTGSQYFPKDIIHLNSYECFVDCGAYTGDTIEEFRELTHHSYQHIVAFDPDPRNFSILQEKSFKKCTCIQAGVWNKQDTLPFYTGNLTSSKLEQTQVSRGLYSTQIPVQVNVVMIDKCPECAEMTFLKMDIEGAELNALKGAEKTIRKNRPTLAICIYHSDQDMIDIPEWILSLGLNYKLYVRHYSCSFCPDETVLYAVPD